MPKILSRAGVDRQEPCHKIHATMFGFGLSKELARLRDSFGALERRVSELETRAPAVSAALLDAQDKLHRAAARWEKSQARRAQLEGDGADEELDELLRQVRGR